MREMLLLDIYFQKGGGKNGDIYNFADVYHNTTHLLLLHRSCVPYIKLSFL